MGSPLLSRSFPIISRSLLPFFPALCSRLFPALFLLFSRLRPLPDHFPLCVPNLFPLFSRDHLPLFSLRSFWLKCFALSFAFQRFTMCFALSFFVMVVADLLSLQKLAQAPLDGVLLLAAGSPTQPSQVPPFVLCGVADGGKLRCEDFIVPMWRIAAWPRWTVPLHLHRPKAV